MRFDNCLYIIPSVDKPIKLVFEESSIEVNEDMTLTLKMPATLAEIAELFNMTIDEVLRTKFGIYTLEDH